MQFSYSQITSKEAEYSYMDRHVYLSANWRVETGVTTVLASSLPYYDGTLLNEWCINQKPQGKLRR